MYYRYSICARLWKYAQSNIRDRIWVHFGRVNGFDTLEKRCRMRAGKLAYPYFHLILLVALGYVKSCVATLSVVVGNCAWHFYVALTPTIQFRIHVSSLSLSSLRFCSQEILAAGANVVGAATNLKKATSDCKNQSAPACSTDIHQASSDYLQAEFLNS